MIAKKYNGNGAGIPLAMKVKMWSTPTASEGKRRMAFQRRGKEAQGGPSLGEQVTEKAKSWNTPLATDAKRQAGRHPRVGKWATAGDLPRQAVTWPTPTASDSSASRRHGYMITGHSGTTLLDAVSSHQGQKTRTPGENAPSEVLLSPPFVEWLMGLPAGWSVLRKKQLSLF